MKSVQYHLEIYFPNDDRQVLASHFAATPFGAFSVGDEINSQSYEGLSSTFTGNFRVEKIEHYVWEVDTHVGHKVCLYLSGKDKRRGFPMPEGGTGGLESFGNH